MSDYTTPNYSKAYQTGFNDRISRKSYRNPYMILTFDYIDYDRGWFDALVESHKCKTDDWFSLFFDWLF